MRVIVFVKGDQNTEKGAMPTEEMLREMGNYNDELIKAGVMLSGEGLHPTKKGAKIKYAGKNRTVVDGPFAEAKEIVAGFWILEVKSFDEAVQWLKKAPFQEGEIEIRQIFEAEDFGAEYTPELRAQEERQRKEIEKQHKK